AVCGAAGDEDAGAAVQHGDVPALRLDSPGAYGGGLRAGADLLKLFGGHFSSSFFARAFLAHAMARSIARYPRPAAAPAMQSQSRVSRGVIGRSEEHTSEL